MVSFCHNRSVTALCWHKAHALLKVTTEQSRAGLLPGAACQAPSMQKGLPSSFSSCNGVYPELALIL